MIPTILLIPLAFIIGASLGYSSVKLFTVMFDKILTKRARAVINGKLANKYELDGKRQDVNTFILNDKKDKRIVVELTKLTKLAK